MLEREDKSSCIYVVGSTSHCILYSFSELSTFLSGKSAVTFVTLFVIFLFISLIMWMKEGMSDVDS